MRKFFQSGGYGLSEEQLDTPDLQVGYSHIPSLVTVTYHHFFKVLVDQLGLSTASTDEIIEKYFASIVGQQQVRTGLQYSS